MEGVAEAAALASRGCKISPAGRTRHGGAAISGPRCFDLAKNEVCLGKGRKTPVILFVRELLDDPPHESRCLFPSPEEGREGGGIDAAIGVARELKPGTVKSHRLFKHAAAFLLRAGRAREILVNAPEQPQCLRIGLGGFFKAFQHGKSLRRGASPCEGQSELLPEGGKAFGFPSSLMLLEGATGHRDGQKMFAATIGLFDPPRALKRVAAGRLGGGQPFLHGGMFMHSAEGNGLLGFPLGIKHQTSQGFHRLRRAGNFSAQFINFFAGGFAIRQALQTLAQVAALRIPRASTDHPL